MNRATRMYHEPVLLQAAVEGLVLNPEGIYADVTFGGGGHSRAILSQLGSGRLFAFDRDSEAAGNVPKDDRIAFLNQNFRFMASFLRLHNALPIDGILADLGVSSHQIDRPGRGFSIRSEGPLDMRMDQTIKLTAADVVNNYSAEKLAEIFRLYGELSQAHRIAAAIDKQRNRQAIETTGQLIGTLSGLAPRGKENKFFARVFQAIRIEVNEEIDALKDLLEQGSQVLRPGGRMVIISYHSLEDRLVKNFFRAGNFAGEVTTDFFGYPIKPFDTIGKSRVPDAEEIAVNPRARSARMRIAEKRAGKDS